MNEGIYNLFSSPQCNDIHEILGYAIRYATTNSHAIVTIGHIVYGFMKFCEVHKAEGDGDFTLFPWFVQTESYEYLSKLWNITSKDGKSSTIAPSNDVITLSSMYKKYFSKNPDSINIETFYHLICYLQETEEFKKRYVIPYIRDYKIANFGSFINSFSAHKYLSKIKNFQSSATTTKKNNPTLTESKMPPLDLVEPTYDSSFFSTTLKVKGTTDITYRVFRNHSTDIIGRKHEISRLIDILSKMKKNNAVLIGNPGVGKTAIVEALAHRIVTGDIPKCLKYTRILELDLTSLISGSRYRGDFEEKVKAVFTALENSIEKFILFIDEIHSTISLGATNGDSLSLSDMLKPFAANSKVKIIGTSTFKEYKRFEDDKALERRFDTIIVEEPTFAETLDILRHLKPKFEKNHCVEIADSTLKSVIRLANQYIPERYLPDKAIDILDETCAIKANSKSDDTVSTNVLPEDVLLCISYKKNIPLVKLQQANSLINLEETLSSKIIGQSHVINSVSTSIRRAQAGLNDEKRPLASFMFIGPTGVGKTEIAKVLSDILFTERDSFIRFDMSEYMEEHSVSKLIGSPPGYVGYENAGLLTEQVRRHPYSLVLFDEFEKAHPKVYNILLQILDEGCLTDSHGDTINFKNTIIILTSNVGVRECNKKSIGFGGNGVSNSSIVIEAVKKTFSPEFLNRLDEIIQFNSLSEEDIFKIAKLYINTEIISKLRIKGITVKIFNDVISSLAHKGYSLEYGARELKRTITHELKNPLADFLLKNSDTTKKIFITLDEGNIRITADNLVPV